MNKTKARIPEGGAIEDAPEMSMEQYSELMRKQLGGEYRRFIEHVVQEIKPPEGARVLEIGPGPGWVGIGLVQQRRDLTLDAVEASPDMIRVAEANASREGVAERTSYVQGVVEDMAEVPSGSYDLVISRDSLHHWQDPLKAFREIARVLKPQGKLYIRDSRRDQGWGARAIVNIMGPLLAGKMAKYWRSSIAASYTPAELESMLRSMSLDTWVVKADFMDVALESAASQN
ncbi:MAG: class I SAM-dependent methyltransferase [Thermoflexales bacterium]|nr:class I SAM-dependent methyltransferase [Thermoflexales bacterium]